MVLGLARWAMFCETARSSVFPLFCTSSEIANLHQDRKSQGFVVRQSSRTEARAQTQKSSPAVQPSPVGVRTLPRLPNSSPWHSGPCRTKSTLSFPPIALPRGQTDRLSMCNLRALPQCLCSCCPHALE